MNWDRIEGGWKQFAGNVKHAWGRITGDQLDMIEGRRDHLAGRIQAAYGISKEVASRQLTAWQDQQRANMRKPL